MNLQTFQIPPANQFPNSSEPHGLLVTAMTPLLGTNFCVGWLYIVMTKIPKKNKLEKERFILDLQFQSLSADSIILGPE